MHLFYIIFTTAIAVLISVTTAFACKRYTKHRVTIKHRKEDYTSVNNYGEVSKKRSSFDGVEVLEMKELKDDKLTNKRLSQLHKKTLKPKPLFPFSSKQKSPFVPNPPPILPPTQPPTSEQKEPPKPPPKVLHPKAYDTPTTCSSFETEEMQTKKETMNGDSIDKSSSTTKALMYQNKGGKSHSSRLTPNKQPMMPPKSPPEISSKPPSIVVSIQPVKPSSTSKSSIYQNKGGGANSSITVCSNQATVKNHHLNCCQSCHLV